MDRKKFVSDYYTEYRNKLNKLLDTVDVEMLTNVIDKIIKTFKSNKTLYVCGNGGSAATASHMNVDFQYFVRYFTKYRPKIVSLTDNVPFITAIGNDNSYDEIFVEQMKGKFVSGDVIICISASGNSMNVVKAAEYANANGGTSIAFVGFSGGKLKEVASMSLYTPNPKGDYGPIEDLHMIYDHFIVNYIVQDKEFLNIQADEN
jgi:D-sedoheptulose 7-phosphate isomerase